MEGDHFMGDKVPGRVKDRLPIIPDHVVDALNKGVDVPMEAFVSGPAMEHLQDRMAARNEPVRRENLIPVARDDPRIAPRTDGVTLPKVPSMRRVIPAPFQRPAAVMRQDHGRSWQIVRADRVDKDDIVIGLGKIVDVQHKTDYMLRAELLERLGGEDVIGPAGAVPDPRNTMVAVGYVVVLSGMGGSHKVFNPDAPLRAFAKDGTGEVIKL